MYSKHSKQNEKDQFVRMPVLRAKIYQIAPQNNIENHAYLVICNLEQYQLACTKRIQQPEGDCRNHCAKKAAKKKLSPLYPSHKHSIHLLHMTFGGKKYDTSSKLNKVPPMGAPKATATPAAHAALRISRRFAVNIDIDLVNQIFVIPKHLAPTFIVLIF